MPGDGDSVSVTGQIEGVVVAVGSRVGGRVEEVFVKEGHRVTKGEILVRLESAQAEAEVAAADAALAQATHVSLRGLDLKIERSVRRCPRG